MRYGSSASRAVSVMLTLAVLGARAAAQAPGLPEQGPTPYTPTLESYPDLPGWRGAFLRGLTDSAGQRFIIPNLDVLNPVSVMVITPTREDDVRFRLYKDNFDKPLREASTRGTAWTRFMIRTQGELRMLVSSHSGSGDYQLVIWVGDTIEVPVPSMFVPVSNVAMTGGPGGPNAGGNGQSGASAFGNTSPVTWAIAGSLAVIAVLLALIVFRKKGAQTRALLVLTCALTTLIPLTASAQNGVKVLKLNPDEIGVWKNSPNWVLEEQKKIYQQSEEYLLNKQAYQESVEKANQELLEKASKGVIKPPGYTPGTVNPFGQTGSPPSGGTPPGGGGTPPLGGGGTVKMPPGGGVGGGGTIKMPPGSGGGSGGGVPKMPGGGSGWGGKVGPGVASVFGPNLWMLPVAAAAFLYDFLTAMDQEAWPNYAGLPGIPTACAGPIPQGVMKGINEATWNGPCGSCYKDAHKDIEKVLPRFEKLRRLHARTVEVYNVSIAFGNAAAMVGGIITASEWMKIRNDIQKTYANYNNVYDAKNLELKEALMASMQKVAACELKYFNNPSWYDRYGFMFVMPILERHRR